MERPLILAVDDAHELLVLMTKALAADYDVRTAETGTGALRAAALAPQPDLILLDVEMPGMSGFEVCKALKEDPATAEIPVIFLTGKGESKYEVEGFTLGAEDYVTKPINATVLKMRVRAHLALANRRAELERLVRERTSNLETAHVELIHCLGRAMECHESAAAGKRFQRMAQYAKLLAQAAGARPAACDLIGKAAPLSAVFTS